MDEYAETMIKTFEMFREETYEALAILLGRDSIDNGCAKLQPRIMAKIDRSVSYDYNALVFDFGKMKKTLLSLKTSFSKDTVLYGDVLEFVKICLFTGNFDFACKAIYVMGKRQLDEELCPSDEISVLKTVFFWCYYSLRQGNTKPILDKELDVMNYACFMEPFRMSSLLFDSYPESILYKTLEFLCDRFDEVSDEKGFWVYICECKDEIQGIYDYDISTSRYRISRNGRVR